MTLARLRGEIDKEFIEKSNPFIANPPTRIKIHNVYYTLGRFDLMIPYEAPSEKEATQSPTMFAGKVATERLVAIPREKALQLLTHRGSGRSSDA